jgi:Tol biopolymer transport system component
MPETQGDIWIMQADGSGPVQLTDGESANFGPVWSPDGRVYFTSLQNGRENVWSVKPTPAQMAELPVADEDTNTETEPPKGVAMQAGPSSGG